MAALCFRSRIEINNINPYVLVDAHHATQLQRNWRKTMPVLIQVDGKPDTPWRTNLMPIGDGAFYLYLHGQVRKAAAADVGDVVSVSLQFDNEYKGGPAHPMPSWFGDELDRNPRARRSWDDLTPSRQSTVHGEILERGWRRVTAPLYPIILYTPFSVQTFRPA